VAFKPHNNYVVGVNTRAAVSHFASYKPSYHQTNKGISTSETATYLRLSS